MSTLFRLTFAEEWLLTGPRIVEFECSFTARPRQTGKQRPPNREPLLRETWLAVIEKLGAYGQRRQIAGRSPVRG